MAPEPTRMYPNGPTRLFSTERFLGGVPYSGGELKGFAGMFVCDQCRLDVSASARFQAVSQSRQMV